MTTSVAPGTSSRATRITDAWLALAILIAGTWAGTLAVRGFRAAGEMPRFYQPAFGPAVMLACGRGFVSPDSASLPALQRFLEQGVDSFDCGALPAAIRTFRLDAFQSGTRYLEYSAAAVWRLRGVSWSSLDWLGGVMFGLVAALTYLVLRPVMVVWLALAATLASVVGAPNLMLVPHLRDYGKGPFLLAVIATLARIVTGPGTSVSVVGLSALTGLVVGIGFGFRTDLIVALGPTLVTIAFLVPATVPMRIRALAAGLFVIAFYLAAFPILRYYAQGGNTGHVALLGFAAPFDGPLRIEPSLYEVAGQYNDSLAYSIINSYRIRVGDQTAPATLGSGAYEQAARGYLTVLATTFPADVLIRVAAAVRAVPKYFLDTSLFPPIQASSAASQLFYRLRASVLSRLAPLGFVALAATAIAIAAVHPRAAWLIVVVMVGFGGAAALQFHERHFYYLQVAPYFALAFVGQQLWNWRTTSAAIGRAEVMRATMFAAIIAVVFGAALFVTRSLQQRSAAWLFGEYESGGRVHVSVQRVPGGEQTLLTTPGWQAPPPQGTRWIEATMIAVTIDDRCGAVPLTARYSGDPPDVDLTETFMVPGGPRRPGSTVMYVVAFDRADDSIRFRGIELPDRQVDCVTDISTVTGLDRLPLLLSVRLPDGWRGERLYQRLR